MNTQETQIADYDMQYDVQLQKAIEVMNEKLK